MNNAHNLFFTPEDEGWDFTSALREVQEHVTKEYSGLITGEEVRKRKVRSNVISENTCKIKGLRLGE